MATEDEVKFVVFAHHPTFYESHDIEIKQWLRANWNNWEKDEKDRPEWFTARVISLIPATYLPRDTLSKLGGETGRRASLDKLIEAEDLEKLVVAKARKSTIVNVKKKKSNKKKKTSNQVVPA